ncbi:MAG: hypothetical protein J5620_03550 [Alphaproteobacteria bacterium]|nr:hypothetical protein [Alphaproteobacteria bacterium]
MRIRSSIMLGILLSFMVLCAVRADSTVTSKSYVDSRDALKQDKISAAGDFYNPQGGSSIVTRTETPGALAELWIAYTNEDMFGTIYGTATHSDSVPTSFVVAENFANLFQRVENVENTIPYVDNFQTRIPARETGAVVVYNGVDGNGQTQFGELAVFPADDTYNAGTDADKLATMGAVMASMAASGSQPALSGTGGAIVTYGASVGETDERAILNGQYEASKSAHIPTAGAVAAAVQTIGNQPISVMECANPECTLWNISQRTVLSPNNNAPYSGSAFVNPNDYTGYTPYNP